MHENYKDILSRIKDKPIYWDCNAVPRFALPTCGANELRYIYCQNCRRKFWIQITNCYHYLARVPFLDKEGKKPILYGQLKPVEDLPTPFYWFFGDPPFHTEDEEGNQCRSGYCMSSIEDWAAKEFWDSNNPKFSAKTNTAP